MHCFGGICVHNFKISIFVHKYKFKKIFNRIVYFVKKNVFFIQFNQNVFKLFTYIKIRNDYMFCFLSKTMKYKQTTIHIDLLLLIIKI